MRRMKEAGIHLVLMRCVGCGKQHVKEHQVFSGNSMDIGVDCECGAYPDHIWRNPEDQDEGIVWAPYGSLLQWEEHRE